MRGSGEDAHPFLPMLLYAPDAVKLHKSTAFGTDKNISNMFLRSNYILSRTRFKAYFLKFTMLLLTITLGQLPSLLSREPPLYSRMTPLHTSASPLTNSPIST